MDTQSKEKFKKIVGPTVQRIKESPTYKAVGDFRPLAELLIRWYERKVAEEVAQKEVKKYENNSK